MPVKFIEFLFTEMTSPLKITILTCLLSLLVLLGGVNPVLAKKKKGIKQKVKKLENIVSELEQKMKEQDKTNEELKEQIKEQDETIKELTEEIKEQDIRLKEQEGRIKTLEECEGMYNHHRFVKRRDFLVFGLC